MTTGRRPLEMALAVCAAALACSAEPVHPPVLGDCPAGSGCDTYLPVPGGGNGSARDGGSDGAADGAVHCGQITFPNGACQTCMDQSCCSHNVACSGSQDCLSVMQCVNVCPQGNTVCTADCLSQNKLGASIYTGMGQCMSASCTAECQAADAGPACGDLDVSPTCAPCVTEHCCSYAGTCSANADCRTILLCAKRCTRTDSACRESCQAQAPSGLTAFINIDQCMFASCSAVCP